MTGVAIAIAVAAALCWAGFDATRKAVATEMAPVPLVILLSAAQAPIFVVWLLIEGTGTPGTAYLMPGLGSLGLNVLANLLFIRSLALSPLSATIPLLSFTPVFTALVAIPVVGEHPTLEQWLGIVLVVLGAFLLGVAQRAAADDERPALLVRVRRFISSFFYEPGMPLMAGVALLWSITSPLDKIAASESSVPFHALVLTLGLAALLLPYIAVRGSLRSLVPPRASRGWLAGAALLGTAALGLQLLAFQVTLVSLVEAIKRAVGMTSALVLGRTVFGESITRRKALAVAVMLAGTLLVLG